MQTLPTLVSVEEYLNTSFDEGDREYVDGVIVERNLGEKPHSKTQKKLIGFFIGHEHDLHTYCFPEQRVQVLATRFRVPDVCVYIDAEPDEDIFRTPPFLVVEILSKDDRASDLQEKIDDYLSFGVAFVWVIDPRRRAGSVHTSNGSWEARDGLLTTRNPDIALPLADLF